MFNLEDYFHKFRMNTIGYYKTYSSCYGMQKMLYADWTASGRLYRPIEDSIVNKFGPFVGNTHSESTTTGSMMTKAYKLAREKIKKHVNADENDVLILTGFGMTSAVNKLQRILGLRTSNIYKSPHSSSSNSKPLVIITHMEHHSNYLSWLECDIDLVALPPTENGLVDLNELEKILKRYSNRTYKIGAFTACSNVTGIETNYHEMSKLMHQYNGICFIDLCSSAPYTLINMHPKNPLEKLDGIYFSPHKFLGGPGSPGVVIFDSALYNLKAPDNPGGGTVLWTNPWNEYIYSNDIEIREDGGTPGFLQAIKAAMCMDLKKEMGVNNMRVREKELTHLLLSELNHIKKVHILQENVKNRLGIVSFYIDDIHYNLVVKVLNDCFGIQTRGGCSCAGPYGHYLLNIDREHSNCILNEIKLGNMLAKPGWIRISLHPMMKDREVHYIVYAINELVQNTNWFKNQYSSNIKTGEFSNRWTSEDFTSTEHWF